ncbi:MAG: nuclear transport factor 2 family protein [Gammaproteobacteria bacterium]|jgi:ketosteroid isomerase-like protein|nr:nuclear transport factor 2 family protein [Gammaproteobacteria bacterium]
MSHDTPQAAEDAYYDALEEGDLERLMAVWDDSDDIACLLPMQPIGRGREAVREQFREILRATTGLNIQTSHLQWMAWEDTAVHLVEETLVGEEGQRSPPIYASNLYHRGPNGWRMVIHQNAPTPPPPGMAPPMARR